MSNAQNPWWLRVTFIIVQANLMFNGDDYECDECICVYV